MTQNRQIIDAALIYRITKKDEAALGLLYDRYSRLVMSIALNVVRNRNTAEEITLDVFTRIWQKADGYDAEKAKISTWITRMTRNRAIDYLRRLKVRPEGSSIGWGEMLVEPAATSKTPEQSAQENARSKRVRAAIRELPEKPRAVISLAYLQGYSHSQIAAVTTIPLGTVKSRIRSGMNLLRKALVDESY